MVGVSPHSTEVSNRFSSTDTTIYFRFSCSIATDAGNASGSLRTLIVVEL
jgi:hypothetical protein